MSCKGSSSMVNREWTDLFKLTDKLQYLALYNCGEPKNISEKNRTVSEKMVHFPTPVNVKNGIDWLSLFRICMNLYNGQQLMSLENNRTVRPVFLCVFGIHS